MGRREDEGVHSAHALTESDSRDVQRAALGDSHHQPCPFLL